MADGRTFVDSGRLVFRGAPFANLYIETSLSETARFRAMEDRIMADALMMNADAEALMMNSTYTRPDPEPDLTAESLARVMRGYRAGMDPRFNYAPSDPDHPDARAHKLLLRLLTPEQREEYETYRRITLHIGEGEKKRIYELRYRNLQVAVFDHAELLIENWCAFIPNAPREDTLVAQLLALRSDPDRLRRVAHVTIYSKEGEVRTVRPPAMDRAPAIPRYRWALELMRRAGYLRSEEDLESQRRLYEAAHPS